MTAPVELRFLTHGDARIAYRHSAGRTPGIVFCPGFKSDMTGDKALALEEWCCATGRQYTRFDYQGHGESSGEFEDTTLYMWVADALAILDEAASGGQIVVGSSMGGWIAFLMALRRPERVAGVLGIAPAVDFTEELLRPALSAEARHQIETKGVWYQRSEYDSRPYPITRGMLEDGRRHLILGDGIAFEGPVRILQGMCDEAVPWRHAIRVAEAVSGKDVVVSLVKDGDHRLSRPQDLARLVETLAEIIGILTPSDPQGP